MNSMCYMTLLVCWNLYCVESVCCCIPMFSCKCGGYLKETDKSVIRKIVNAMVGSVKKLGRA